jgi:hypothetical protein
MALVAVATPRRHWFPALQLSLLLLIPVLAAGVEVYLLINGLCTDAVG